MTSAFNIQGADLAWDAVPGAASHNLYSAPAGSTNFTCVALDLPADSTSYTYRASGVTPTDQYYVTAVNSVNESGPSPTASAASGADAPDITLPPFSTDPIARQDLGGAEVATFLDPGGDTNAGDFQAYLYDADGDYFDPTIAYLGMSGTASEFGITATGSFDPANPDGTQTETLTLEVDNTALVIKGDRNL